MSFFQLDIGRLKYAKFRDGSDDAILQFDGARVLLTADDLRIMREGLNAKTPTQGARRS